MSIDTRSFRDTLGQFATGVCVITTAAEAVPKFGMTVNSFSSLSLEPPLVIWSIGKSSECFDDFNKVDSYAINVLSEDQQALSGRYSKRGEHALVDGDWSEGDTGMPVLNDVLASFECDIVNRVDGGDHVILVGAVKHFNQGHAAKPLLFFSGGYRTLAD